MSVTVSQTPAAPFSVESPRTDSCFTPTNNTPKHDVRTLIQSLKSPSNAVPDSLPTYVHPLVHRSSIIMGSSSLQICTESLGSETGSGDFSDDDYGLVNYSSEMDEPVENQKNFQWKSGLDEGNQHAVKYHRSARKQSATHSFPPPLPSLSRQMRTCRQGGRLVVEAVPVASENYLHARRHDGRLLLTFVDSASAHQSLTKTKVHINGNGRVTQEPHDLEEQHFPAPISGEPIEVVHYQREADHKKDEEEVEVVDRRPMAEVNVGMQVQLGGSAKKVLCSSLVINKFVGGAPPTNQNRWAKQLDDYYHHNDPSGSWDSLPRQHKLPSKTTTTVVALVATTSRSASQDMISVDNKKLHTIKRRNGEEMLNQMRRCSEHRQPLFFLEAGCVVSSSR